MRRYYIKSEPVGGKVALDKKDSHHALNVLRLAAGDEMEIVTPSGDLFLARITDDKAGVELEVLEELVNESELPVQVTVACGISKGDKLETIAQKGTECGMYDLIPVALKRDVSKWEGKKAKNKVERLNRITEEAAKQSKRLHIPPVWDLHSLSDLLHLAGDYDYLLVADEELGHANQHDKLHEVLSRVQEGQKILALFGSEGGFERDEIQKLQEAGFQSCSLGPRILRAETAPIYFLSAVSYVTELAKG